MMINKWWSLLAWEYEDLQNITREYEEIHNGKSTFKCAAVDYMQINCWGGQIRKNLPWLIQNWPHMLGQFGTTVVNFSQIDH